MELSTCASDFLDAYRRQWSRNTATGYRIDVMQFVEWMNAQYEIGSPDEITDTHIVQYHTYLHNRSYARTTIERKAVVVRAFLRYLKNNAHISRSLDAYIPPTLFQRKTPQFFSPEEIDLLFEALQEHAPSHIKHRDSAIIRIMYATGMRTTEVSALDFDSIERVDATMRIRIATPKPRVVVLDDLVAQDALDDYLREERPELIRRKYPVPFSPALFFNTSGQRFSRAGIWSRFRFYAQHMTLPTPFVNPRTLRNTAIRNILINADPKDYDEIEQSLGLDSRSFKRYLADIVEPDTS